MSESDDRDPYDKVLHDADTLHEAAIEALPPDLRKPAGDVLQAILRQAKARPLMALLVAALIGFVIASVTSR